MAEARVERWKRNLLDLSLRNRLLNAKDNKQFVPLSCDDIGKLEDRLSANVAVNVDTPLSQAECQKRLKEIYRAGRIALEESGVNSVYVAVGFLEWKKDADEKVAYRAPVLLVPVRLERKSASGSYRMVRLDEETRLNTTLVEFLRSGFGIVVPSLETIPEDDSGVDVGKVIKCLREAVCGKGWDVAEEAVLGFFSFGKMALWHDIASRMDVMRKNPLVDHLAAGGQIYDDGIEVFPPDEIAQHIDQSRLYCPLAADASQLTAVLYSELGKTFVLHGPPGTGKSQTIANIIAHNLALGRSVLFVSEKKAALDVVHKRLQSVGLGAFCLELHSNKSGKAQVLAQFSEALGVPSSGEPSGHSGVCASLAEMQEKLAGYVRTLHHVYPNGRSAYELLSRASRAYRAAYGDLIRGGTLSHTTDEAASIASSVSTLAAEWAGVDVDAYKALSPIRILQWTPDIEASVRTAAQEILLALDEEDGRGLKGIIKRLWVSLKVRRMISVPFFAKAADVRSVVENVLAHLSSLRLVLAYREKRTLAIKKGLGRFADAMESGVFAAQDADAVYEDLYASKMLSEILSKEKVLSAFSGLSQDEAVRAFRENDALYQETVKAQIAAKLSACMPSGRDMDCPEMSELGILKRECEKKTRHKPVRQLLSEIESVSRRLKPCFLMSPLSVSQYLPVDSEPFDLVIFDEASQIPVWDAIGVIARGRQLIVVGDPKQMPPTNFFQKGESDSTEAETSDVVEDMESILDESLALGMHSSYLHWHYRSRHESLISFSNERYYGGKLNTFPAATIDCKLGVRLNFVHDGVYDASGTRTNVREAETLVDWLFTEAIPRDGHRSFGIVTFSMAQKNLIEDLIEKRRAGAVDADAFFDDSKEDAFFVKNLENVQGDERDVIVFSVCYAPDANGRFSMNFGPLNRQGGERRLNVAVTRAREQVVVFSSVHGSQIDLHRTNAVGVKHLREFLEIAEQDGKISAIGNNRPDALIMSEVFEFLTAKGYKCKAGVGASNRKIDIAVCSLSDDGKEYYILGIVGDGPEYGSDLTVRDRDSLWVQVLQSLGWNVFRLWSVDWRLDRDRTEKRLLEALDKVQNDSCVCLPKEIRVADDVKERALRPNPIVENKVSVLEGRRDLESVSDAELQKMQDDIVKDFGKCSNDAVYREIVHRLGYSILSSKARKILESKLGK